MVVVFVPISELSPRVNNMIVTMTTTPSINPATQPITIIMRIRNFFCWLKAHASSFFHMRGMCYSDVNNFHFNTQAREVGLDKILQMGSCECVELENLY